MKKPILICAIIGGIAAIAAGAVVYVAKKMRESDCVCCLEDCDGCCGDCCGCCCEQGDDESCECADCESEDDDNA